MELNNLCRTCLAASEGMKSLYKTFANSMQLCYAEMLSTCTPFICFKDDGLPTMICPNCIRELSRCNTFQLKCIESDGVLRKQVQGNTGGEDTNITVTNEQPESRNQQLDVIMVEDCSFEEASQTNEFPISSQEVIPEKSLKDPLPLAEMQLDLDQELDIVKHEVPVDPNITKDEDIHFDDVNNTSATEESEKPYSCKVSNKSYKYKQSVSIYMRTHAGENPYSCTVCNSSFQKKALLKSHLLTHTEGKFYLCTLCDSSFKQNCHLTRHMRTHTGEKPYSCTVCGNSFTTRAHFRNHMMKHTGEKPYSCTICNKSFRVKYSLKLHMRTHTGEKPYP